MYQLIPEWGGGGNAFSKVYVQTVRGGLSTPTKVQAVLAVA